jgi:hypothetical protein
MGNPEVRALALFAVNGYPLATTQQETPVFSQIRARNEFTQWVRIKFINRINIS